MSTTSNQQTIAQFLETELGLTKAQAAGVLGNLEVESGFNPTSANNAEGAYGIAQWENGRFNSLIGYANKTGGSASSLTTQLGFLKSELTGAYSGALTDLKGATTPTQAAYIFDTEYEKSTPDSIPTRESDAEAIFAGKSFATGPGSTSSGESLLGNLNTGAKAVPGVSTVESIIGDLADPFKLWKWLVQNLFSEDFWIRIGFIVLGFFILLIGIDKLSGGGITGNSDSTPIETVDVVVGNSSGNQRTAAGRATGAPAKVVRSTVRKGERGASRSKDTGKSAPKRAVEGTAKTAAAAE